MKNKCMKLAVVLTSALMCLATVACKKSSEPTTKCSGSITYPTEGAEVSLADELTIKMNVTAGSDGVDRVLYYANGSYIGETAFSPYSLTVLPNRMPAGNVSLYAEVRDTMGYVAKTSAVNFVVKATDTQGVIDFESGIPSTVNASGWTLSTDNPYKGDKCVVAEKTLSSIGFSATSTADASCLNFAARGDGSITVYADGDICKVFTLSSDWNTYSFNLPVGRHAFNLQYTYDGLGQAWAYIDQISWIKTPALYVGMFYQGGLIATLDETKQHGTIIMARDLTSAISWCGSTLVNCGAEDASFGAGPANTEKIMSKLSNANCAGRFCADLVLWGYDDWYLPSKGDFDAVYNNVALLGKFGTSYWTSTEHVANLGGAWIQFMSNGTRMVVYKLNTYAVRAMRNF